MMEFFTKDESKDIIDIILEDHKQLKDNIEIMKDLKKSFQERQAAFQQFAPLLLSHAKPEELTWYVEMEKDQEMRVDGLEGEVEHVLAEQLVAELRATKDEDLWSAKAKVLAELVEHHIKEEEDEQLPEFKHSSSKDRRIELGQKYLRLKDDFHQQDTPEQIEEEHHPSIQ